VKDEADTMLNSPEISRSLARQRERELIDEAQRNRQAKTAREHARTRDSRQPDHG
jgi:hypothetical protein